MTISLLARTAVVSAATGAVLLASLTVAGAAGAGESSASDKQPSAGQITVAKSEKLVVSHGRKLA
jgi:hypothetical protein